MYALKPPATCLNAAGFPSRKSVIIPDIPINIIFVPVLLKEWG
jgi:hypothetical protein